MNIASYIIYSQPKTIENFISLGFTPILATDATKIEALHDNTTLFNTQKSLELLNREITASEIARTLSHIQCWKAIAENETLQEEDFGLVAESAVKLVDNVQSLAQQYANRYPSYGIIKLQRNGATHQNERLFATGDEPDAIIYGNVKLYNQGCSLYLIRKNVAKKLTALLSETKPYWLADQFIEFHEAQNIAQARYLLGEVPAEKFEKAPENPLFSIIIPIYNVERYLKQCIDSVLAQDYQSYEIILVDDGSPDNSMQICLQYAKQYKHIMFIRKINGGLSDARNAGINIARGKYLMFLDSDDYWEGKQVLSDLANLAEKDLDIVMYNFTFLYPDKKTPFYFSINKDLTGDYTQDFAELVKYNIFKPSACTKVIKRSLITDNKTFFSKGKTHEDLDWSFKIAPKINSYAIYNQPFYYYRTRRKGSITEVVKPKNTEDLLDIVINHFASLDQNSPFYKGLLEYLFSQKEYILDSFKLLSDDDKKELTHKYNQVIHLFEKYEN